jgi:hypothetical protein
MENVAKAFDCIFEFNTVTKTINVKTVADATTTSDIFLSFDNVIENASFAEKSDEIISALSVYGGNDLSIRLVNPLGTSTIYNFDYYANLNWMSQGLIDAITAWKALLTTKQSDYANLLTLLRSYTVEKITLQGELSDLNSAYAALEIVQATRIQGGLDYSDINSQLVAKQAEIDAKNLQITNKQTQIDSTTTSLETIQSEVSFEVNFTSPQLLELENFIIENTYQNSNIIKTDSMTAVDEQDAAQALYDQAQDVLSKVSQPRYELSLDAVNFISLPEFDVFTDQLELGTIVTAELKDGSTIETVVLELQFSFDDPTDFKMTLSNRLRLDGDNYKYSDLMGTVVETGSQLSFNSAAWSNWGEHKDDVTTFITSALDATVNNLISNSNREITIDQTGLRGRASDGVGGYEANQVWLTNNVLAFSDDSFESAKLALGQISLPEGGTAYGLVAGVVVGHLLAGNMLRISNETNNFVLDSTGATLTNAKLTSQTANAKIIIDPTTSNSFVIQKNVAGVWTNKFLVDVNGDITFSGALSGATGTFSGSLSAATGTFAGALSAATGTFAGSLSAATGTFSGDISAANGTFSGNIYAANLNGQVQNSQIASLSADKITAGTISAVTITGSTITGNTISGGTINGTTINWPGVSMWSPGSGWSRIDYQKLELYEDDGSTSITMDAGSTNIYGSSVITLGSNWGTLELDAIYLYSNVSGDGGFGYSDKIAISTPSGTRYLWFDNGILTNFTTT